MYKNQKFLAFSLECFSILLLCFCIFTYSLPCLVFILIVPGLVLLQITSHVVVALCALVTPYLKCIVVGHCSLWLVLFFIQFALLQVVIHLGFYYSLTALYFYYSFFAFIVVIHFLPSLLLFIVHPSCCLFCVTIIRFGLFLALGCYCLPCIINVHSSFCVTTTCLGTHLTILYVVIACTSPCVVVTYSLPCVYPTTYWGVVLPPLLAMCKLEFRAQS
jgi:hypothetical protein